MTSINEKPSRANIRIEIKNDVSEAMDIDSNAIDAEIEDGEISDSNEQNTEDDLSKNRIIVLNKNESDDRRRIPECDDEFFGADDHEKRETRAKRFGLDVEMMTDQELSELHESLGITDEERVNVRFDALHMYGTQEMSTQDVFAYFGKYMPNSVEWINDESCNVVWLDKATVGRALNSLSRIISGMPVQGACDPFQKTANKKNNGTSILLLDDTAKRDNNIINVSDLNIPIPPGFWRLGEPSPKSKHILLRYAKRTDKKPQKAEKFSEYYRKYGNPNYGGIRGIISESKKARMKGETETIKGNPWGRLAKDWNKDVLERPEMSNNETNVSYKQPKASKSLLNRLGTTKKRPFSPDESEEEEEPAKKSKVPRMRMYADEEEARVTKMKELKKIRALEKIEETIEEHHVPDLRNRLKNQKPNELRKPLITSRLQMRPIKQEIKVTARNDFRKEPSVSESASVTESDSEDELNVQQRSKVTVIVKKPSKPTVASTIWSRLADEKNKKPSSNSKNVESDLNSSSSGGGGGDGGSSSDTNKSDSESETDAVKNDFSKTLNPRPGFRKDLKSRLGLGLGLNNSDHKSPLRIEINNDHYKNTQS